MPVFAPLQKYFVLALHPGGVEAPKYEELYLALKKLQVPFEVCRSEMLCANDLASIVQEIKSLSDGDTPTEVIVFGGYLEEQISLTTRFMLAVGFNVHLPKELIYARFPKYEYVHDHRLRQAGAVATTLPQILYEWAASERDQEVRKAISEFTSLLKIYH